MVTEYLDLRHKLLDISDKYKYDIFTCAQCGFCRSVCPMVEEFGWESNSPRGKLFFLKQELKKNAIIDEKMTEKMFLCTTCGNCEEVCQTKIPLVDLWEDVRYELNELGHGPLSRHAKMGDATAKNHNPYNEDPSARGKWMSPLESIWRQLDYEVDRTSPILFFGGCTGSYRMTDLNINSVEVLAKAGVKFNMLGPDEWCCGSPLLRTGQVDVAESLIKHNILSFNREGIELVVTSCAGCYKTLTNDYPMWAEKFGLEYNVKAMHIIQYIDQLIKEGKIIFTKEINKKVTYHDPCHLGRHMGIYDEPRNVLKAIPGIELVEMEHNKADALCCGAGGGVKAQFPDVAVSIGKRRVKEALDAGVDIIANCCGFCWKNLNDASEEMEDSIEIVDVAELVLEAMGVEKATPSDRVTKLKDTAVLDEITAKLEKD